MKKILLFLILSLILFHGCNPPQTITLVNEESARPGINFLTLSVEEGISGTYIDDDTRVYFQALRGTEKNPWAERFLEGGPTYPVDVRYISRECGDAFIIGVGGNEPMQPDWVPENFSITCEGEKRKEEFRTAWKIADELERADLPSTLDLEKEALIMLARSIREEDLQQKS